MLSVTRSLQRVTFPQLTPKRYASYTVDVYLLKAHPKLGPAGSVVAVAPGYARNVLLPDQQAILMGEGPFRKNLPVLFEKKQDGKTMQKVSVQMILAEKELWLNTAEEDVRSVSQWLLELDSLVTRTTSAEIDIREQQTAE